MRSEHQGLAIAIELEAPATRIALIQRDGRMLNRRRLALAQTGASGEPDEQGVMHALEEARACLRDFGLEERSIAGVGIVADSATLSWQGLRAHVRQIWPDQIFDSARPSDACALGEIMFGNAASYNSFIWVRLASTLEASLMPPIESLKYTRPKSIGLLASAVEALPAALARLEENPRERRGEAEQAGQALGEALVAAVRRHRPTALIVGGELAFLFELLQPALLKALRQGVQGNLPTLLSSNLGPEAPLRGAASLVYRQI